MKGADENQAERQALRRSEMQLYTLMNLSDSFSKYTNAQGKQSVVGADASLVVVVIGGGVGTVTGGLMGVYVLDHLGHL